MVSSHFVYSHFVYSHFVYSHFVLVSQARLSLRRRESGQIPIRLLYCILSSRAPNEVGVSINWNAFCKGRSSV